MTRWLRAFAALCAFAIALVAGPRVASAKFAPPPRSEGHIVDTAGVLSDEEVLALERKLNAVRRAKGPGIVVFIVASLDGTPMEDVAYETFNAWGVGGSGKDDGVLLVIALKERKVRIETGQGAGGALTDLQSNDIIREVIGPALNEKAYLRAIDQGTSEIAAAFMGEAPPSTGEVPRRPVRGPPQAKPVSLMHVALLAGLLIAFIVLCAVSPGFRRFVFFLFEMMMFSGFRGGGGGGYGGGDGGGSGYGGGRSGGGGSTDDY